MRTMINERSGIEFPLFAFKPMPLQLLLAEDATARIGQASERLRAATED